MTVKWEFYDPSGAGTTYQMEINPNTYSLANNTRSLANQSVVHGNKQILFQGRNAPVKMSFGGTLLSENQYNALVQWAEQRKQIRLTDDLGRQFWIYITSFIPSRQLKRNSPWYFNYTAEATVLDWQ